MRKYFLLVWYGVGILVSLPSLLFLYISGKLGVVCEQIDNKK